MLTAIFAFGKLYYAPASINPEHRFQPHGGGAKVRIKLTRFQRCAGFSLPAKAGMGEFGKPLLIQLNNWPSVCTPGTAWIERSAVRGFNVRPTGPSPLPSAPWQGKQYCW